MLYYLGMNISIILKEKLNKLLMKINYKMIIMIIMIMIQYFLINLANILSYNNKKIH